MLKTEYGRAKFYEYREHFGDGYSFYMAPGSEDAIIAEIEYCIKNNISQYDKVKAEFMNNGMTEEEFKQINF